MPEVKSLQERYAPHHICYGCGPANESGLQIRSFVEGDKVVCTWKPSPEHTAFPGILAGGVIGMLFDCHSNWTAAWHLIEAGNLEEAPTTVTAEFHVKLLKPTALDTVTLIADAVEISGRRVVVEAELHDVNDDVTATCRGVFVAVKEDHPVHGHW